MSITSHIEDLAKAAALTDPQDLQGLVALQEKFEQLGKSTDSSSPAQIAELAISATKVIEQIVLREVDDAHAAFTQIHSCIERAQKLLDNPERAAEITGDAPQSEIDEELLNAWLSSCTDGLSDLEARVLEIEADGVTTERVGETRRIIHTIKGECGVLSLHIAQKLCHEAESLIDATIAANQTFPANPLLGLIDWMKSYVAALADSANAAAPPHAQLLAQLSGESEESASAPPAQDVQPAAASETPADPHANDPVEFPTDLAHDENINDFLCEAREHIAGAEDAVLSLEQDFTNAELINTVFRAFHTIKGVAGFMHLQPIVELAHNAEFLLDEARTGRITLNSAYLDMILNSCDFIAQLIAVLEGAAAPTRGQLAELIDRLKRASKGEITTSPARPASLAAAPKPASSLQAKPAAATDSDNSDDDASASKTARQDNSAARRRADQTVKVNTLRLDNLVTMVGELVIAQQMVVQDEHLQQIGDQRFQRNLAHSGKIIRDLQEVAMSLRMVTLKGTFQKMSRLVRDVSAKAHKDIRFNMEGEDTELDRNIVEEIADPLVHMIRNSCDHGIETAEERIAAGKPGTGTLTLRAYHQGGSIIIEVVDDGRGLNRERIFKKALERGLISSDRNAEDIPDQELYNLIMMPGFSTAEKVTDISGRGVGMDVVRRNIEAMRGKVEIHSKPGKGSTIRMALPLTMAIIDGMVVRVGSQRYVIPTLSIEQSLRPTNDELHTVAGRGEMASVRGSLLPIHRLNQIFDLNEGCDDIADALLIVLESNDSRCCLLVDEIIGQQQVVIKSLGQGIDSIRGVSGGAILGDGRVALIIDVGGLIDEATAITA